MAATIKIKRSAVSGKAPALGDLALGELGLNTYDGKLYTRKDNGTASIVELSGGGAAAPSGPITEGETIIINQDFTLGVGRNGLSLGPVEIAAGYVVTVPANAYWVIL